MRCRSGGSTGRRRRRLVGALLGVLALAGPAIAAGPRPHALAMVSAATIDVAALRSGEATARPSGLHPDRQIERLSLDVGRMILIGFPGTDPGEAWPARAAAMIEAGRIGGVVLFGENIRTPDQLRGLTRRLAGDRRLPPLIAIDQEGGVIQRLPKAKGFHGLPSARFVGGLDPHEACGLYADAARELAGLGINVNLGPVVDLDRNPANPAIGKKARSYDRNPDKVVTFARAFIDAHRQAGILTVAKHFPGHGSALLDPHKEPVDISATWRPDELSPYAALFAADPPDMVMVGHLFHPRFSDGRLPASLSLRTIRGELRGKLGYDGLIVTDDLKMSAITSRYALDRAAVLAVAAGADLLIIANQKEGDTTVVDRVTDAIVAAVVAGRIPHATIAESARRITAARARIAAGAPGDAEPACGPAEGQPPFGPR